MGGFEGDVVGVENAYRRRRNTFPLISHQPQKWGIISATRHVPFLSEKDAKASQASGRIGAFGARTARNIYSTA